MTLKPFIPLSVAQRGLIKIAAGLIVPSVFGLRGGSLDSLAQSDHESLKHISNAGAIRL
jgi:hypothetical protein